MSRTGGRDLAHALRLLVLASLAVGGVVFLLVATRTAGWLGLAQALASAVALAVVTAGAGVAAIFLYASPSGAAATAEHADPDDHGLAQVLHELEDVRIATRRMIIVRAAARVPLCGLAGLAAWWLTADAAEGAKDLPAFVAAGAVAGWGWAAKDLSDRYRRLYKARVLPQLAKGLGALFWRPGRAPVEALRSSRLFGAFDEARADDEIFGRRHGVELSLLELQLIRGKGKNRRIIFDGLLCTVQLPRTLRGLTLVGADKGGLGNLLGGLREDGARRVTVEDPEFEALYEVYGTDQVAARALLTPAFMSRMAALVRSDRFGAPLALARDGQLLLALPRTGGPLFEAPSYAKPAAARDALASLEADLARVVAVADAVIDLDFAARRLAQRHARAGGAMIGRT